MGGVGRSVAWDLSGDVESVNCSMMEGAEDGKSLIIAKTSHSRPSLRRLTMPSVAIQARWVVVIGFLGFAGSALAGPPTAPAPQKDPLGYHGLFSKDVLVGTLPDEPMLPTTAGKPAHRAEIPLILQLGPVQVIAHALNNPKYVGREFRLEPSTDKMPIDAKFIVGTPFHIVMTPPATGAKPDVFVHVVVPLSKIPGIPDDYSLMAWTPGKHPGSADWLFTYGTSHMSIGDGKDYPMSSDPRLGGLSSSVGLGTRRGLVLPVPEVTYFFLNTQECPMWLFKMHK